MIYVLTVATLPEQVASPLSVIYITTNSKLDRNHVCHVLNDEGMSSALMLAYPGPYNQIVAGYWEQKGLRCDAGMA